MGPRTRRRLLRSCVGALAIPLAGCSDRLGPGPSPGDDGEGNGDEPPRDRNDDAFVNDVAEYTARLDVEPDPGEPIVDYDDDGESGSGRRLPYVIDADDLEALRFRHESGAIDDARAFLRSTDFEEESVFVVELPVSACHRWALQFVERRRDDRLAPRFCRVMREPSVECSLEDDHLQLTLIRVPLAYETPPRGSGLGRSSRCRLPPGHPERDEQGGEAR